MLGWAPGGGGAANSEAAQLGSATRGREGPTAGRGRQESAAAGPGARARLGEDGPGSQAPSSWPGLGTARGWGRPPKLPSLGAEIPGAQPQLPGRPRPRHIPGGLRENPDHLGEPEVGGRLGGGGEPSQLVLGWGRGLAEGLFEP